MSKAAVTCKFIGLREAGEILERSSRGDEALTILRFGDIEPPHVGCYRNRRGPSGRCCVQRPEIAQQPDRPRADVLIRMAQLRQKELSDMPYC